MYDATSAYLVVEVVKQSEHTMLIVRISFINVLQELDLIKTLIKVVLVVLHPAKQSLVN